MRCFSLPWHKGCHTPALSPSSVPPSLTHPPVDSDHRREWLYGHLRCLLYPNYLSRSPPSHCLSLLLSPSLFHRAHLPFTSCCTQECYCDPSKRPKATKQGLLNLLVVFVTCSFISTMRSAHFQLPLKEAYNYAVDSANSMQWVQQEEIHFLLCKLAILLKMLGLQHLWWRPFFQKHD